MTSYIIAGSADQEKLTEVHLNPIQKLLFLFFFSVNTYQNA